MSETQSRNLRAGLFLGPTCFLLMLLVPMGSLSGDAKKVAASVIWMAIWWVSEAAPLAITSLLPLVLFPLLGVRGVRDVAPTYGNHMVFLFLGGFILALAVQHTGLHKRLALAILDSIGAEPRRQVWGFLLATALLSMWLSNTATTLMMLPIAAGVALRLKDETTGTRLFLAVAFGASIGGVGTLVGTPPNLVLAGMAPKLVKGLQPLSFGGWMLFGVPFVLLMLPVAGLFLSRRLPSTGGDPSIIRNERRELGGITKDEVLVAAIFALTALAWITRSGASFGSIKLPGWGHLFSNPSMVSDAVPAIAASILISLLPSRNRPGEQLLEWGDIRRGVPWGVLLLFGGGFALADAVKVSGLGDWLASSLSWISVLPVSLAILLLCLIAMGATELTSNTATATLLMPITAALAGVLKLPPYLLMVPITVACSCAFMLPVATPPNAIVIGSGHVNARQLFREGFRLNLAAAVLITFLILTLGRVVLPL